MTSSERSTKTDSEDMSHREALAKYEGMTHAVKMISETMTEYREGGRAWEALKEVRDKIAEVIRKRERHG